MQMVVVDNKDLTPPQKHQERVKGQTETETTMTGFHPVWNKKVEKNPSLVLSVETQRLLRRKRLLA
jgi:hypothetical protein